MNILWWSGWIKFWYNLYINLLWSSEKHSQRYKQVCTLCIVLKTSLISVWVNKSITCRAATTLVNLLEHVILAAPFVCFYSARTSSSRDCILSLLQSPIWMSRNQSLTVMSWRPCAVSSHGTSLQSCLQKIVASLWKGN